MSYTIVHSAESEDRIDHDPRGKKEKKRRVKHFSMFDLNEIIQREDEQDIILDDEVEELFYQ